MMTEVMVVMTEGEDGSTVHEEEVATDVVDVVTIVAEGIGGAKREAKNNRT
jgi:hypothetical protein